MSMAQQVPRHVLDGHTGRVLVAHAVLVFHRRSFVINVNQGIALVYTRFSTWKGTVLHLEDLIVSEHVRGHGIGSALLDQVILYGDDQGVKRICWEVINWNSPAIEFYEHKGARVMRDWNVVQLDEQGMKQYISKLN